MKNVKQLMNIVDDSRRQFKNPQTGRIYDIRGICPTIHINRCSHEPKIMETNITNNTEMELIDRIRQLKNGEIEFEDLTDDEVVQAFDKGYLRIRKLTPRECFRLMDVVDWVIDKIFKSGLSNSACYKLAGNSIVVNCIYLIFKNVFKPEPKQFKDGEQMQLF